MCTVNHACAFCVLRGYEGTVGNKKADKGANDGSAAQEGKGEPVTKRGNLLLLRRRPELVFHVGRSRSMSVHLYSTHSLHVLRSLLVAPFLFCLFFFHLGALTLCMQYFCVTILLAVSPVRPTLLRQMDLGYLMLHTKLGACHTHEVGSGTNKSAQELTRRDRKLYAQRF